MSEHAAALIHLRLKGFVKPEALGAQAAALVDAGLADLAKLGLRLTPAGRAAADSAWEDERSVSDIDALEEVHTAFLALNSTFKALVADWQLRAGIPNDHGNAVYDAAIVTRLANVDSKLAVVLAQAVALLPRLARYAPAFSHALARLSAGEARWMAAPIIDSYHTLWFELHEELIRLTGRTRAGEAAAGHAA